MEIFKGVFLLVFLLTYGCSLSLQTCSSSYTPSERVLSGLMFDVWGCANYSLPYCCCTHVSWPCGTNISADQPISPCLLNDSGYACGIDFERAIGDDRWICNIQLDPVTRIPTFNDSIFHETVISPDQFYYWYRSNPGFNIPFNVNMTTSNADTCNSQLYTYSDQLFFPLDGRGFGNFYLLNGEPSNFGMTFQAHMMFTYQGNETFEFAGDDDVFVFINNILTVDLGGVHVTEGVSLDLSYPEGGCSNTAPILEAAPCAWYQGQASLPCACILNLTIGGSYGFDLFYNERHTVASDLQFTTSLLLQCPYYDHCGICQGNGQSCCTCKPRNYCETAACAIMSSNCIYTPISCPPTPNNTLCEAYVCEDGVPCKLVNVSCDDGDACTEDICNDAVGCQYIPIECNPTHNPCNLSYCNSSIGCVPNPVNCTKCTGVTCNPIQSLCAYNACSYQTGDCVVSNITCNDDNHCSYDQCDPSKGCVFPPITCNDNDLCTIDSCNSSSGCVYTPVNCDDGNACTNDSCNPSTGNCTYTLIPLPMGNKCTLVYCNPETGIQTTPTECPLACSGCDNSTGCTACPKGSISTAEVAGISAGIIAAIIIAGAIAAGVIAYGSKKGYDYFKSKQGRMGPVNDNPLYENTGGYANNPLFDKE